MFGYDFHVEELYDGCEGGCKLKYPLPPPFLLSNSVLFRKRFSMYSVFVVFFLQLKARIFNVYIYHFLPILSHSFEVLVKVRI